jgi:O-antigen/teichoic acid export membrane protein
MANAQRDQRRIRALAVVLFLFGLLAFLGSFFLWGQGILLAFPGDVDLAYPITDILVNAPASILAAVGLWQLRRYGYVAAQFVAGFYVYASVEIFVQVFQDGPPYAMEIVMPQVLAVIVAVALVSYLWRVQDVFQRREVKDG